MNNDHFLRGAALLLFTSIAGCSAEQPAMTSHGGAPSGGSAPTLPMQRAARYSVRSQSTATGTLYLAINSLVEAFSLAKALKNTNPKPTERITGFLRISSLAIDANGDLFVADTLANTIYAFKPGHKQPYDRYYHGLNGPSGVAVGSDGTVYVLNAGSGTQVPNVVEYAPHKHRPTQTLAQFDGTPTCVGLDGRNNLYVAFTTGVGSGGVDKFAAGSTSGTNLNLLGAPQSAGITVDQSGDIVLAGIVRGADSGYARIPATAFYLSGNTGVTYAGGAPPLYPSEMALTSDESAIVVGSTQDSAFVYQYGESADFVPLGVVLPGPNTGVTGVAISPRDPG